MNMVFIEWTAAGEPSSPTKVKAANKEGWQREEVVAELGGWEEKVLVTQQGCWKRSAIVGGH